MKAADAIALTEHHLQAEGVYDAKGRAGPFAKEIEAELRKRGTPHGKDDLDAGFRRAFVRLRDSGDSPSMLTPRMVLDAMARPREHDAPGDCMGCEQGVLRMMDWSDGAIVAFACDCAEGQARRPALTSARSAWGRCVTEHPCLTICYDFAKTRANREERRGAVEQLFEVVRLHRPSAVRKALAEEGPGVWPNFAALLDRIEAHTAGLDRLRLSADRPVVGQGGRL